MAKDLRSNFDIYILIFLLLALTGCSKDENLQTGGNIFGRQHSKISSIEYFNLSTNLKATAIVNYDNFGRIESVNSTNDSAFTSYTAVYKNDVVILKRKYYVNSLNYHIDTNYNRIKKITSEGSSSVYNFEYDSSNYLSKITRVYTYGNHTEESIYNLIYTNQNLTRINTVGSTSYTTLEYTTDLSINTLTIAEPLQHYTYAEYIPYGFFGNGSKNMLKKVIVWYKDYNTQEYKPRDITTFDYKKNSGKISYIKEYGTYLKPTGEVERSYTKEYNLKYH